MRRRRFLRIARIHCSRLVMIPQRLTSKHPGPRVIMRSCTYRLRPLMIATTAMMAVTPMMIPSSVRNDRSGFARSDHSAMRRPSARFTRSPGDGGLGLRGGQVGVDPAVVNGDDAPRPRGDV